ncbi:MAG: alpha/beta fold hydrolase [Cyanobacteria bacterium RUI128]|nr:alpha/beta fold hydrolase [Cyanobacteria bacterium RUI128]
MKKYGQYLCSLGYDVFCDCLPGHGDKVEEIYTVSYKDWLNHAYNRFEELRGKYDEVYLSGLCLGAVLALAIAEKYPNQVDGIIALSTTLFLDGWRLPWYKVLIPIGLSTIDRFYYTYPECEPYGIKNIKTRRIVSKLLEKSDVGMVDFPMTCIFELLKLSRHVRNKKLLRKINTPILFIHSKEDDLTSPRSAHVVYNEISSADKNMIILNDSYHMVLYDNEKDFVFETAGNFLNSHSKVKECVPC